MHTQPRLTSRKKEVSSRSKSSRRRCTGCGGITYLNRCPKCGAHTIPVYTCPKCGHEVATERCPNCDVPATCSQRIALNVKAEYAQAMERLGIKKDSIALVKGVKGVISREKTVEAMEKGILRAQQDIYVFKDGTTRFDMIDLPLTHIRPDEVRVPVEKMRELGYIKDVNGYDLQNGTQVIEMHPQDLLLSDSCADYMVKVAQFIDDELTRLYGLPAFYQIKTRDDLVGHLVIGLAPHTSAGFLPGSSGLPGQMSGTPTRSSMRLSAATVSTAIPKSKSMTAGHGHARQSGNSCWKISISASRGSTGWARIILIRCMHITPVP